MDFAILIYPTVSNQWNTYRQNQLISSYEELIGKMAEEDFTKEWEKANAFNDTIIHNNIFGDVFGENGDDIKKYRILADFKMWEMTVSWDMYPFQRLM